MGEKYFQKFGPKNMGEKYIQDFGPKNMGEKYFQEFGPKKLTCPQLVGTWVKNIFRNLVPFQTKFHIF